MTDCDTKEPEAAIREIASDNISGAAEILRRGAAVFSLLKPPDQSSFSVEQARNAIIKTSVALVNAQPDMSSLLRLASETVSATRAQANGPQAVRAAVDAAARFAESALLSAHAAAMHAVNLIGEGATVLTHSRSSTVLEALIEARRAGKHFEVVATESRPMFEGRKLANELASNKIKVTMIADAAASVFIQRANIVLVGADKITTDHAVNKIGTRMIALAARERGLLIYAVCDTSKFIADDYLRIGGQDQMNASELWPAAPTGVMVVNRYFESTPLSYFTGIVTDLGVLSSVDASLAAEKASIDELLAVALEDRGIK